MNVEPSGLITYNGLIGVVLTSAVYFVLVAKVTDSAYCIFPTTPTATVGSDAGSFTKVII